MAKIEEVHMTFRTYQEKVRQFADYPVGVVNGNEVKLLYPVLGLVEEIGEAKEKIRLVAEDGTADRIDALINELGDVCWFCAEILSVLGFEADLSRFHDLSEGDFDLPCAEISGILAKSVRDNDGIVPAGQALVIKEKVEDIIWTVSQIAPKMCLTYLKIILQANYNKLLSQQERGVIHGSGEDR